MKKLIKATCTVLLSSSILTACAPLVVGGAAGAALMVAHDRRSTGTILDDNAIELKINQAMSMQPSLKGQSHINVVSYNNVVLLVGQAQSNEMRDRIEKIVRGVPKIRSIYNEITVAAPTAMLTRSSDSLITSKIKKDLLVTKEIDATRVKVVTEDGVAYLLGLVTKNEGETAAQVARRVEGVKKVIKIFEYV